VVAKIRNELWSANKGPEFDHCINSGGYYAFLLFSLLYALLGGPLAAAGLVHSCLRGQRKPQTKIFNWSETGNYANFFSKFYFCSSETFRTQFPWC